MVKQINHALVAKAHTPMFLIHKYWARKPHNVVGEYISSYTELGDIVLDPFAGSGVTAIEALRIGRKAIAFDLNPVATFITRMSTVPVDIDKLTQVFAEIESRCRDRINALYLTTCPTCGSRVLIAYVILEREKPIEIGYQCDDCISKEKTTKRFLRKKPDDADFRLLAEIDEMPIPYWTPSDVRLAYNGNRFLKAEKSETIGDLFDRRSLISLSILFHEIEGIHEKEIRDFFKIMFTSNVHNVSKLNPVHKPRWKIGVHPSTSWIVHSYWVPDLRVECPVWFYFEERFGQIISAKEESNKTIPDLKEAKSFDDLKSGANLMTGTVNALEITNHVPNDSVDYIFTDPPYGGAVQYFELSTLWSSWLKMDMNYSEEITLNTSQKKDFDFYHKMLKACFREMYQVLKPGKYMTVTFHSTDIAVWNSIIKAVVINGFDLQKIVYQPPARPSAKGLSQPYGSAVGDYYIRFRKPESAEFASQKEMDNESYEREVVFAAKGILERRGEPTIYQHILNGIMVDLKGGRFAPVGARNVEEILKEHVGREFALINVLEKKGKAVGKKWWLKDRDFSNFTTPTLSDRVERAILSVLDKKVKVSFDDILQSVFIDFPNALTPESDQIRSILEEYAKQTPDGKWILKPGLSAIDRESAHSRAIYILGTLGKRAKFDVWIGQKEQSAVYKKSLLKDLCDDIRVFKFVPQESLSIERIKQIDVLWLDEGRIVYEFEVENTTGISEAIIRGSNIPSSLNPKRFIVIPKERENFLFRKLQEPVLQETLKKVSWNFATYDDIESVFDENKRSFDPVKMDKIGRMPRMKNATQKIISEF